MTTPTNKHGKARTRSRRANHDKMTLKHTGICNNCGADKQPHRACPSCGFHRGRLAIEVKKKTEVATDAPTGG